MSIFGSRNKTSVGTQVQRVIEDSMLTNSIQTGSVKALIDHSDQTVDYVMEEMVFGMATKMDQYYRRGRDKYIFGLPTAEAYSSVTGRDVVENALEADVGPVETISYYKLGALNLLHLGWLLLVRDHGYDSTDNSFMVGTQKVYLSNMQPVVVESNFAEIENGSMDVWGTPPTAGATPEKQILASDYGALSVPPAFIVDPTASEDYIKVSYCWEVDDAKEVEGIQVPIKKVEKATLNLSTTGMSLSASYFQVRFIQDGKAGYWMYQLNSGEKPAVEAIFDTAPVTAGTFFPWAYFRFDKKQSNADKTSTEYRDTKALLKSINMDYDQIADSINENPDITDVEQAIMMMAVPAKSDNEVECKYLFDFFTKQYISAQAHDSAATSARQPAILEKLGVPLNKSTIVFRDKRFKMALSFSNIVKHRVAGSIGKIGHHASGTNINADTKKVIDIFGGELSWTTETPTHYYRRQITENIYEELLVANLKMTYWIWGDYTTTADENDDILLIPVDYSIANHYQMLEKEELYGRSLHYIFNSRVVTKLKWYQTGIFRAVVIIAAIVITFMTGQVEIYTLAANIAIAYGTGAIVALIIAASIYALDAYLVNKAMSLFIKKIDKKAAAALAVIAIAAGVYQFAADKPISFLPSGQELLSVATSMTKVAVNKYFEDRMADLADEYRQFEEDAKAKNEQLKQAEALLNGDLRLTPMIIWGETPDDFYQRTVHSGNIGMVGIEAVSSFVEMRLTLPKLTDTLGDFYV